MTTQPCPPWCELPAGHPFDGGVHPSRWHVRHLGDVEVARREEVRLGGDGVELVQHGLVVSRTVG